MAEEKTGAIQVPERFLREFEYEQIEGDTSEAQQPEDSFTLELAEKSLASVSNVFDDMMKKKGGVGLAGISPEDFSKMGVLALEDLIPREVLENSPKAAFSAMCTYIGAANLIAIKRRKKNTDG